MFIYPTYENRDFASSLKKQNPKLRVIRLEQSKFKGGASTKVVNFGNFTDLEAFKTCKVVNPPKALQKYCSREKIFEVFQGSGICPQIIKDPQKALDLFYKGETLYYGVAYGKKVSSVRQILSDGHSGLYIRPSFMDVYRVHISNKRVLGVDKYQKTNKKHHENGFSVKNIGELPKGLLDFAKKCFSLLEGVDFCQLHIGYNAYKDSLHLDDIQFNFGNFCERINNAYIKDVLGMKPVKSPDTTYSGTKYENFHLNLQHDLDNMIWTT